ncbi:hypothetical protein [Actinosynnema sp. ALI-1.44]|uniref:hypothetical protein n=1 Tax=Actinosynnema sp. ALI-1.44 TaxID=1933779 RepID=UPI00117766E9|nr:hypothetical protein [Actinosynnema sp. ALI-1.44]
MPATFDRAPVRSPHLTYRTADAGTDGENALSLSLLQRGASAATMARVAALPRRRPWPSIR